MSEQLPLITELAPSRSCPFCGSTRTRVKKVWETYRFVACQDCKAGGPVMASPELAVKAWNRRAG